MLYHELSTECLIGFSRAFRNIKVYQFKIEVVFHKNTFIFFVFCRTINTGLWPSMVDTNSCPNVVYGQPFHSNNISKAHDPLWLSVQSLLKLKCHFKYHQIIAMFYIYFFMPIAHVYRETLTLGFIGIWNIKSGVSSSRCWNIVLTS